MINAKNNLQNRGYFPIVAILILVFSGCSQTENRKTNTQENMKHITHKNPKTLFDPTPFAFSHATSATGNGNYIFISGQSGGEDIKHTLSNDFRTQVRFALQNLQTVLKEYDLKADDVLKITILIVDHDQEKLTIWKEEMHKVWTNNEFPASTLIPVPRLALDGMLIEVDAVAFRPS